MVKMNDSGGNNVLKSTGILLKHYTVSQPRRPRLEPTVVFIPALYHIMTDLCYLSIIN